MANDLHVLKTMAAAAALAFGFGAVQPVFAKDAAPVVEGTWVRLPSATGRPAGGYLVVKGGTAADALVAASSPKAERVELHSMVMDNGVMRMRAESSLAVPANGSLTLAPGGNHLMLFGLDPAVKAGDRVPVTLTFKSGAKISASAEVRPVTAPAKAPDAGHQH